MLILDYMELMPMLTRLQGVNANTRVQGVNVNTSLNRVNAIDCKELIL